MISQLLANPETPFFVACALLLLAVAVIAVVLKPVLALWALAVLYAAESATPVPLDASLLKTGSTHIYPADALAVVLLIATAVNLVRRPPPARIVIPLTVAGAAFAMNLGLGIAAFGLHHAVNESREWLYLLVTTAFVVTAGPWTSRFWRPWFALAFALVGLAWVGLARYGLHSATAQIIVNGQRVNARPLTAAGAVALALVLVVMMGSSRITPARKIIFGAVLICTILVSQQRTVWVLLAVTFLIWAAVSLRRRSTARHRHLATTGVAVLILLAAVLAGGVATGNVFDRSLTEATATNSTLQWRLIGWSDLLHSDHSTDGLAFGFPFGTGYHRAVLGVTTNAAPHSFYVATILRLGFIGLVALCFLYWNVWKYRRQAAATLDISPLTVALLLVGLLVYSLTYEPGYFVSSLIAGLLVWEPGLAPQPVTGITSRRAPPILQGHP
jgi:hypothetical protein